VTSPKVKNRSLRRVDFAPGQLPAGERGPEGRPGPPGQPGQPGAPGAPGSAAAYGHILALVGGEYQIDAARSKNVVSVVQREDEFGTAQPGTACVDVSVPVNNVSATIVGAGTAGASFPTVLGFCDNTAAEDFAVFTQRADGTGIAPEHRSFMFVVN
jgi:hypothetical protein